MNAHVALLDCSNDNESRNEYREYRLDIKRAKKKRCCLVKVKEILVRILKRVKDHILDMLNDDFDFDYFL